MLDLSFELADCCVRCWKLLSPPKLEVSCFGPHCCSTRRALGQAAAVWGVMWVWSKWSQQPATLPSTAQGVPMAWELACDHVKMFPLAGRSIAAVSTCLLSTGFRLEEVLCPRTCWFPSFLLQSPMAAAVAGALPSGHNSPCWSLAVGSALNVSSQGPQAHGQIRLAWLPIYSARCLWGTWCWGCPGYFTQTYLFPDEYTLMG